MRLRNRYYLRALWDGSKTVHRSSCHVLLARGTNRQRPTCRQERPPCLNSVVRYPKLRHPRCPASFFGNALPGGFIPTSVAAGDFNGDGNMDFVVSNGGDNDLWLYFGNGDGTFNLPTILPITLGQSPVWVAAADLRGIGVTDLIVVNADSNNVSVFLGKGNWTFTEHAITLPGSAATLAIADFNQRWEAGHCSAAERHYSSF
jgi:hypothetical protein